MHILIADDHKIVRDTLRSLFKQQEPNWKVSEASDGQEAVKVFRKHAPDVAVLDIVMQPLGGVGAAYEIRRIDPTAKIVLISSHFTPHQASTLSRLIGAGAFVPKSDMGKLLTVTIRKLLTEPN